jgi:hypothetical protein
VDAGLLHRRLGSGTVCDFYRQRVLIPVRDDVGRVCGFIGRSVGGDGWPKYKNPPHTHAYDKSVNLYQPLPAASHRGQVVVVEGTLDAIAIAVAAVRTGVAEAFCPITQSGRELSETQVRRIIALHPAAPVLSFDGDAAGQDSAVRYARTFAHHGTAVAVAVLPGGHDPASWLAAEGELGLSAWCREASIIREASGPVPIPAATFLARCVTQQTSAHAERMQAVAEICGLSATLSGRTGQLWAEGSPRSPADSRSLGPINTSSPPPTTKPSTGIGGGTSPIGDRNRQTGTRSASRRLSAPARQKHSSGASPSGGGASRARALPSSSARQPNLTSKEHSAGSHGHLNRQSP